MKTETGRYFLAFSMIVLLAACAPMTKLTSVQEGEIKFATQNSKKDLNHTVLARNHEKLAKEMRVKAQEQKEILKNKPSTSYEKAVEVNLSKAAHHKRIAQEQVNQKMFTKPDNAPDQIDKAKFKLNNSTSTETTEKL